MITDIRLSEDWQLTASSTGDVPLCSARDCFLQDIRLEAVTTPGEVFYNPSWGWGLQEYLRREYDGVAKLEIGRGSGANCRNFRKWTALQSRYRWSLRGQIRIDIFFRFVEESGQEHLQVSIDRVRVEVVDIAE